MAEAVRWSCGVLNCGAGAGCVHELTGEDCPDCQSLLVRVKTTGYIFCSAQGHWCQYERVPRSKNVDLLKIAGVRCGSLDSAAVTLTIVFDDGEQEAIVIDPGSDVIEAGIEIGEFAERVRVRGYRHRMQQVAS